VSVPTINSWLSVLAASYIVYLLPPYFENIGKRLVKTPKVYFYDTGLATFLLGIDSEDQLEKHPLRGALFGNYVINEMLKDKMNKGEKPNLFFYRDQSQREIDVICPKAQFLEAYEIKSSMSYNREFFKQLAYIRQLLPGRVMRSAVIYDGDSQQDKPIEGLWNFRNFRLESD